MSEPTPKAGRLEDRLRAFAENSVPDPDPWEAALSDEQAADLRDAADALEAARALLASRAIGWNVEIRPLEGQESLVRVQDGVVRAVYHSDVRPSNDVAPDSERPWATLRRLLGEG